MEASRKPLARVEGRRRLRLSGLTIVWRGTPSLDDWVAYIVRTKSKKFILADHASERKVKTLLSQLQTKSKKEVEKVCEGFPLLVPFPTWNGTSWRGISSSRGKVQAAE